MIIIELLWKYELLIIIILCCWKSITKSCELPPYFSKSHKLCGNWHKIIIFNKLIWLAWDWFCEDNFATLYTKILKSNLDYLQINMSCSHNHMEFLALWNMQSMYKPNKLNLFLEMYSMDPHHNWSQTQMEELFGKFVMIFYQMQP